MSGDKRPTAFWVVVVFFVLSIVLLVMGQTTAIFAYEFAVGMGLQESVEEFTPFGVEVNRGFGVGDTVVYIPLMIISLVGLFLRKRWALFTTAAVMGISAYWSLTCGFILLFLKGVPGYQLIPGIDYGIFLGAYLLFGIWGILYMVARGDELIR